MRKTTLKDIEAVKNVLDEAKERKVGLRLSAILMKIEKEDYNTVVVITDSQTLAEPILQANTVMFTNREDGTVVDIDELAPQFRWDAVSCIWNKLQENTDEIENL